MGVAVFSSFLAGLYASFLVSKSPITYYAYAFFPVIFWEEVYAHRGSLARGRKALFGHVKSTGTVVALFLHTILYIATIQSLVSGLNWFSACHVCLTEGRRWATSIGRS
ncbi:phosphatidylinositolglycan class n [Lasius niger]|uniref:Phosphatidylinositolglycan class n n=1 Tax=Lasius niger TaxID=67767 RepID=A0A0J7JUD1_LASNI|nr:phosphatidylinositolglycan class n [Lasius niger]